jgi:glycosyltransferase involved in cell wall biosynthesis
VAYLLSRYPAISHTFFLHEVLGLKALGMEIETASINAPDRSLAELPLQEAAESGKTFYVKGAGAAGRLLRACAAHPLVLLRGFAKVLRAPRLTLRERAFWLLYLAEAMLLGAWMRERGLRHLHVHFGGAVATVGMLTAEAWQMPWSLTIHGPEELLNVDTYHLREKIVAAKFVFCISDFCRSQLCRLVVPASWGKFQVMRLGVDPAALQPLSKKRDVGRPTLVCTGRLVPEKGHRVLLEALVLLRESGLCVNTTLIGAGPERQSLEAFAGDHVLDVTFTGALSHAAALALVREADVFALASFAEGVPVALIEAMALGVPCVSTTIAGIPELIESGVDGLLVPPANAEALAAALASLLGDAPYRQSVGARGRQRVMRDYNLPMNHQRLAAAFARETAR